jgi:hypothetical protein
MTPLSPESDRSVRQAVDAYLDGTFRPQLGNDAHFDTRNGSYRLVGGVLFHVGRGGVSTDVSYVGAELVGWLCEGAGGSYVIPSWRPGSRGILVDRRRGRHIVITSATRNFVAGSASPSAVPGQPGSMNHHQDGSAPAQPPAGAVSTLGYSPTVSASAADISWPAAAGSPQETAPACWGSTSASTPAEPIPAAQPAFMGQPLSSLPDTDRSAVAGKGVVAPMSPPAVPSHSPAFRPLPTPVPPPRRPMTPPEPAATATHRSPAASLPPGGAPVDSPSAIARRRLVQAALSAPPPAPAATYPSSPSPSQRAFSQHLDNAATDHPSETPASRSSSSRRHSSGPVQRGMLLR